MGKKKAKQTAQNQNGSVIQIFARKMKSGEAHFFEHIKRNYGCLYDNIKTAIPVEHLDSKSIRYQLAHNCRNIESQFLKLRQLVCMSNGSLDKRRYVTQQILNCLLRHHKKIYEALIFGSSVNGLGFRDSDVDLRLRLLVETDEDTLEPVETSRSTVESTLKNIAQQTTRCSPASGMFAPGRRCPVAKLKFVIGNPRNPKSLREGLNFDISMLSSNSLGSFNSKYIRFLCHLEPKFHLLATVLRYWSKMQELIVPGLLSSYALITMLIFFCQNISPPLLPTVEQMSDAYFHDESQQYDEGAKTKAITRQDWNLLISLNTKSYKPSENTDPLCLLMLKFFEFYLSFPYSSSTIISTRLGKPIDKNAFKESRLFDPNFPLKPVLNIQDPFDLKHNVTSGMGIPFFMRFLLTIRVSYERLFAEVCKFKQPPELDKSEHSDVENAVRKGSTINHDYQLEDWGLNAIFVKVPKKVRQSHINSDCAPKNCPNSPSEPN